LQIATVQIQLSDESEEPMPSLKIEGPSSPLIVTNEAGENLHKCVHEPVGIEDTTLELPAHPAIESKNNPFLSEESSDGSVGCVELNETEKKGLFVF
jgi:hypothetical protein